MANRKVYLGVDLERVANAINRHPANTYINVIGKELVGLEDDFLQAGGDDKDLITRSFEALYH